MCKKIWTFGYRNGNLINAGQTTACYHNDIKRKYLTFFHLPFDFLLLNAAVKLVVDLLRFSH